jgi:hypothetical protein
VGQAGRLKGRRLSEGRACEGRAQPGREPPGAHGCNRGRGFVCIVTRYADALDFAMPTPQEFERAAKMLLKRGYAL